MMTLDRLRYFVTAAQFEHVGRAATKLAISPSVISAAIKTLEEELGCVLFLREKQRIKLTEKGELLRERALSILQDTQKLYQDLSLGAPELKGHYRIGGSHFLMQNSLIPCFLKLQKRHPKITADLMSLDTAEAIKKVGAGELDLALVFRSSYQSKISEEILHQGSFQICVRKSHPILKLKGQTERIAALNQLPAITFRPRASVTGLDFWENHPAFNTLGITPQHAFFYEDTQTALQLLSKTNGWAFMPDLVLKQTKALTAVNFKMPFHAPVNTSVVWNERKPPEALLHLLRES